MTDESTPAQGTPTKDELAETIGRCLACVVSGNNQPHMSGDPRNRLSPLQRRNFDEACGYAAEAVLKAMHSPAANELKAEVEKWHRVAMEAGAITLQGGGHMYPLKEEVKRLRALVEGMRKALHEIDETSIDHVAVRIARNALSSTESTPK